MAAGTLRQTVEQASTGEATTPRGPTVNTTRTTVRLAATTALAGAAILAAAPAYADTAPAPVVAGSGLNGSIEAVSNTRPPAGAVDPGSSLTYLSSLTRSAHGTTYRLDGLYSAGAGLTSVR
jgi:hypothetical protein